MENTKKRVTVHAATEITFNKTETRLQQTGENNIGFHAMHVDKTRDVAAQDPAGYYQAPQAMQHHPHTITVCAKHRAQNCTSKSMPHGNGR